MGYALASTVKRWITSAAGTNDSVDLMERINAIRREWYAWYQSLNLFVDVEECFEVQQFCLDCNACHDTYAGVTLPRYFAAVEAMWFNDFPVRLNGRWRQWHEGIGPYCDCRLQKDDVGYNFPSERDLMPARPSAIRALCFNAADVGKKLVIRGMTPLGEQERTIALHTTPQETDVPFISLARPGGIVKETTAGRVAITDNTGRILSFYDPTETVPAYSRIKISGITGAHPFVNIRAARQYVEVADDLDVCETDNQRAWEAMARYLRLNRKSDRTREDLQSEGAYLIQARELLLGDKARQQGKATRTDLRFKTPSFGAHSLRGRFRSR